MTPNTRDDTSRSPPADHDATSLERYSAVQTGSGGVLLYDERIDDAWIQSDTWTSLGAVG